MIFLLPPMGHGSRLVTKVFSQSRVNEKTVDACHLRAMWTTAWPTGDMKFFAVLNEWKDGRCMPPTIRGKKSFPWPRSQIRGLNAGSKPGSTCRHQSLTLRNAYIWQGWIRADPGVKFDRLPFMWHKAQIGRGIFKLGGFYGARGSVVPCATYKREIAVSIPGCAEYALTLCS